MLDIIKKPIIRNVHNKRAIYEIIIDHASFVNILICSKFVLVYVTE